MIYGYSDSKNEILDVDKMFCDAISLQNRDRSQLHELLDVVQKGDTIVVNTLGRLGWGTRSVIRLLKKIIDKEAILICQNEIFNSEESKNVIYVLNAIENHRVECTHADFNWTNENNGRPKIKIDDALWDKYYKRWKEKAIKKTAWRLEMGLSHTTFYKLFKKRYG